MRKLNRSPNILIRKYYERTPKFWYTKPILIQCYFRKISPSFKAERPFLATNQADCDFIEQIKITVDELLQCL